MRALSLTQPWATLVGDKLIETRSWKTEYRGWLLIHAAFGFPPECRALMHVEPFVTLLARRGVTADNAHHGTFPRGAACAVARLVHCAPTDGIRVGQTLTLPVGKAFGLTRTWELTPQEYALGNYDPNRWAWLLADVTRLTMPRVMKGKQGLWKPSDDQMQLVEADLLGRKLPGQYHSAAAWQQLPADWNT